MNKGIYAPQQVVEHTLDLIDQRRKQDVPDIRTGISSVDRVVNPLRPGELVTVLGRPSHYKTGLAQWWARKLANEVKEAEADEVVTYVTAEMAIEELGLYDLAISVGMDADRLARGEVTDEQWQQLKGAGMKRTALPLWLVGHSLAHRRERPTLSIYTVEQALYWVEDSMDFTAHVVFLDYLNLLQSNRKAGHRPERRLDITNIVQAAKDMALNLGCPVVMLAQAHRRVDRRDWKLPQMADAMESAAIEQYSDKVLSVWYPKVTDMGQTVRAPGGGKSYDIVDDSLLFLGILKQKNGDAGGFLPLYVDPRQNKIAPMAHDSDHESEGIPLDPEEVARL